MGNQTGILNKATTPPPKWYRVFNKVYGNVETLVMGLLLILGYADQSTLLLIIKLVSSFLRSLIDSIMIETTTD
jgi:hypothetical protein